MQTLTRTTTRPKSALLFMPKAHKSSHRSVVESVCPLSSTNLNKHADPNRPRVIVVDSGFELTPTPIPTSRKRKSVESEKSSSSDSDDSECNLKAKKRKTCDRDSGKSGTSSTSSRARVEAPSKLMKAARRNYDKVAVRRKIDVVPQLIDPLARVRSVTPPSASKKTPTVSNVVVEDFTPTKPLRVPPHPRTKTSLFIPKLKKPISGPISLAEYAQRCSEAGLALC